MIRYPVMLRHGAVATLTAVWTTRVQICRRPRRSTTVPPSFFLRHASTQAQWHTGSSADGSSCCGRRCVEESAPAVSWIDWLQRTVGRERMWCGILATVTVTTATHWHAQSRAETTSWRSGCVIGSRSRQLRLDWAATGLCERESPMDITIRWGGCVTGST